MKVVERNEKEDREEKKSVSDGSEEIIDLIKNHYLSVQITSVTSNSDDDNYKDWWTKYYAINEKESKNDSEIDSLNENTDTSNSLVSDAENDTNETCCFNKKSSQQYKPKVIYLLIKI
jgi:hypothetical protein